MSTSPSLRAALDAAEETLARTRAAMEPGCVLDFAKVMELHRGITECLDDFIYPAIDSDKE